MILFYVDEERKSQASFRFKDNSILSQYRWRITISFATLLGIPLDVLLNTWYYIVYEPFIYVSLYLLSLVVVGLFSLFFARHRVSTSEHSTYSSQLNELADSHCLQEFLSYASNETDDSDIVKRLLEMLSRDDILDWLLESLLLSELNDECRDMILSITIFERFEKASSSLSRKDYHRYETAKAKLLVRDDEIGFLFRDSLSRWQSQ
jgi:hypothetical protein